jgi:hypothetical protein
LSNLDIARLESFLTKRFGFEIPNEVEFARMPEVKLNEWLSKNGTRQSKIINLTMNDFLTEDFFFNPQVEKLVSKTIKKENLTIYAGIVSYDGRGEAALATGGNTFDNLRQLEEQGLITRFLSYQGDKKDPSPLCSFALKEGIRVYFVDEIAATNSQQASVVDERARGKTENVLKFILMLSEEVHKKKLDPNKVFVLFLDDDYTLLNEQAHYVLIACWVLSYSKHVRSRLKSLADLCRGVGFVKNGGVRIHFPPFLAHRIFRGAVIKDYRSLVIEAIRLEIDLGGTKSEERLSKLGALIQRIESLPQGLILTPENLPLIVSKEDLRAIRRVFKRFFYPGGRVTKPYTRRNVHEAENFLSDWLGQFTFILQGDQGSTLTNWLSMKLGQGYAFDSSVIIQFLMDKQFADQRIVDIQNTPHAHQPQEQSKVEGMESLINLDTEALRVYYGNWDVDSLIKRYQNRTRVSWLPDGRYVKSKVQRMKGILFYPPARKLRLRRTR